MNPIEGKKLPENSKHLVELGFLQNTQGRTVLMMSFRRTSLGASSREVFLLILLVGALCSWVGLAGDVRDVLRLKRKHPPTERVKKNSSCSGNRNVFLQN